MLIELNRSSAQPLYMQLAQDIQRRIRSGALPPGARLPTVRPRDKRWRSLALQYTLINVIAVLIWLFGGANGDFWPKWVFIVTLITFTRRAFGHRHRYR